MKLPPKYPKDLRPMTTADLQAMAVRWRQTPSADLRAAMWEIRRLKVVLSQVRACCKEINYLYFPGNSGAMSGIIRELRIEVLEQWERPEPPERRLAELSAEARERIRKSTEARVPGHHLIKVKRPRIPDE